MTFIYPTPTKSNALSLVGIVLLILLQVSCGTKIATVDNSNPAINQILNAEINKFDDANEIYIEKTYYNHHFKGVLNAFGNKDRLILEQLTNALTEFEISQILNKKEIDSYIQQLENAGKVPELAIPAGKKITLEDLNPEVSKNTQRSQRLKEIDKNRMIISTPIFTGDKKYALVDVSKGRLNSMYTTINLYERSQSGEYVFYKTLISFME